MNERRRPGQDASNPIQFGAKGSTVPGVSSTAGDQAPAEIGDASRDTGSEPSKAAHRARSESTSPSSLPPPPTLEEASTTVKVVTHRARSESISSTSPAGSTAINPAAMTMHDELEEALDCYGCSYEELLECLDEPARARVTAIYKALAPDTPRSATTRTSRSRQYRALREALFR